MTVYCVNNATTYADLVEADSILGGTNFGSKTIYEQSGTSSAGITFTGAKYPAGYIYRAAIGEETNGDISVGAYCSGNINGFIDEILNIRVHSIDASAMTDDYNVDGCVANGQGSLDVFKFRSTGTPDGHFTNCIAHNCSEGWRGDGSNDNVIVANCTTVNATGFGFLRPRTVDTASLVTNSAAYLQAAPSSSNYWGDDGTGSNAISGTATDIFENYAGGDYRIKAASDVGTAGAGAFINAATGAYEIEIDSGSYTTTGTAINLAQTRSMAIDVGSYLYAGSALSLLSNKSVSIDTGAYSYTGTSLSTLHDRTLAIDSGVYTYTGAALALEYGSLTNYELLIDAGSYSVTGTPLNVLYDQSLNIDAGLYSVTGTALVLEYAAVGAYEITIDTGVYSVSGNSLATLYDRSLAIDTGLYSSTGTNLVLAKGYTFALDSGFYAQTGNALDFAIDRAMNLDTGAYLVTGIPLALEYSSAVTLLIDSYSLQFNQNNTQINYLN
jgi:Uri superfamily endonuclease